MKKFIHVLNIGMSQIISVTIMIIFWQEGYFENTLILCWVIISILSFLFLEMSTSITKAVILLEKLLKKDRKNE